MLSSASVLRTVDKERVSRGLSKAELSRRSGLRPENMRRLLANVSPNPSLDSVMSMLRPMGLGLCVVKRSNEPSEDDVLMGKLAYYGAPLYGAPDSCEESPETVLADGLVLARSSGTVARALPCVFWSSRDKLDVERLRGESELRGQGKALGFFLDLVGELAPMVPGLPRRFEDAVDALRARHAPSPLRPSQFFRPTTRRERDMAELVTPELARRWGFRMNMDFECFASMFRKATS